MNLRVRRTDTKLHFDFQGGIWSPNPCLVQGSTANISSQMSKTKLYFKPELGNLPLKTIVQIVFFFLVLVNNETQIYLKNPVFPSSFSASQLNILTIHI